MFPLFGYSAPDALLELVTVLSKQPDLPASGVQHNRLATMLYVSHPVRSCAARESPLSANIKGGSKYSTSTPSARAKSVNGKWATSEQGGKIGVCLPEHARTRCHQHGESVFICAKLSRGWRQAKEEPRAKRGRSGQHAHLLGSFIDRTTA